MNVPNHDKKAFRDMTPEERSAIVEAMLSGVAKVRSEGEWLDKVNEFISVTAIYITSPRQLVIPWEVIKEEYKWAAMDDRGRVFFYEEKPALMTYKNKCCFDPPAYYGWTGGGGFAPSCLNIDTNGIDWRESLTQRPENI